MRLPSPWGGLGPVLVTHLQENNQNNQGYGQPAVGQAKHARALLWKRICSKSTEPGRNKYYLRHIGLRKANLGQMKVTV